MRMTFLMMVVLTLLANQSACSRQQLYGAGQAWQRNECFKLEDAQERSRCLEQADTSYHKYKQDTEEAK